MRMEPEYRARAYENVRSVERGGEAAPVGSRVRVLLPELTEELDHQQPDLVLALRALLLPPGPPPEPREQEIERALVVARAERLFQLRVVEPLRERRLRQLGE